MTDQEPVARLAELLEHYQDLAGERKHQQEAVQPADPVGPGLRRRGAGCQCPVPAVPAADLEQAARQAQERQAAYLHLRAGAGLSPGLAALAADLAVGRTGPLVRGLPTGL